MTPRNAVLVAVLTLCLSPAMARAGEARGSVIEVHGKIVKIRLDGGVAPVVGASVRIGSDVEGVGFVGRRVCGKHLAGSVHRSGLRQVRGELTVDEDLVQSTLQGSLLAMPGLHAAELFLGNCGFRR